MLSYTTKGIEIIIVVVVVVVVVVVIIFSCFALGVQGRDLHIGKLF